MRGGSTTPSPEAAAGLMESVAAAPAAEARAEPEPPGGRPSPGAGGPEPEPEQPGPTGGAENKCIHIQTNRPIAPGGEREHPIGWLEAPALLCIKQYFVWERAVHLHVAE